MRRVLLVTSSYRPTMIADMHRVRHLAWELPKLGWEVEVLAPNAQFQRPEFIERESDAMFNPATEVHEVAPNDKWWFKPLQIRGIGWRALEPLRQAGEQLLKSGRFDLVFISTANFKLFLLAHAWKRHGVPCMLDYHDPWVRSRIDFRTTRHKIKLVIGALLARRNERQALEAAAGLVSVSPVYLAELRSRYGQLPCLEEGRCEAIPFAGSENDLRIANPQTTQQSDTFEVAYVGAGGEIMAKAFRTLCQALAELRKTEAAKVEQLRLRLYGTSTGWREGDRKPMEEIAAQFGLQGIVSESPRRISYMEATKISLRAAGLLVLGIDGPGYMPSKLIGYGLTGKPLLASFRSDSPMADLFHRLPGLGHSMMFEAANGDSFGDIVTPVRQFVQEVHDRRSFARHELLADFLAPAMARRHARLFEKVLSVPTAQ